MRGATSYVGERASDSKLPEAIALEIDALAASNKINATILQTEIYKSIEEEINRNFNDSKK